MRPRQYPNLAQRLRLSSTDAERRLWYRLRERRLGGFKFRRQTPIKGYVVDFACLSARLIVELDGGQHADAIAADARRSAVLAQSGLRVLRFWNDEVLKDTEGVLREILRQLVAPPSPAPGGATSPAGGRGD